MSKHKRSRSDDLQTIKDFWAAGMVDRRGFVMSWLTPLTSIGLGIAIPYLIGKILASLTVQGSNPSGYVYALVTVSILTVVINGVTFSSYLAWQPKVMAKLQAKALDTLMHRSLGFHNNQVSGKLVSDALDYPAAFSQLSTSFFVDILPFFLIVTIGIGIVSVASPLIGLVLFTMTFIAVAATIRFRTRMAPYRKRRQVSTKAVTSHLADTIVNTMTVKSFGNEQYELANHSRLGGKLMADRLHDWGEVAKDGNRRIIALLVFQIAFVTLVIHQVHRDPTLLATGIFAFSYTVTLTNRLFQIATMMRSVEESLLLAAPMTEMFGQTVEIADKLGATAIHISQGRIELRNVHFRYEDTTDQNSIFSELNVTIHPGEKIGLVGPSGGGKSTLTRLLLRFEDIQSGTILIDDQDITAVTQSSLHQAIGYVAQEPLLFHRSIRENVAYGKLDATDAEIEAATRKAYAYDFIQQLPAGLDTIVGERGVKLSGGQRQRIAIARAILKDAPILLLDEATSALDSESERVIQKALYALMKGRTTLVIAHRLSTIQTMDRILVLDAGKIIEEGSHTALLKQNGLYATLWGHQSGGFIEE